MKKMTAIILASLFAAVSYANDISMFDLDLTWRNQRNEEVVWSSLSGRPMVVCMFFSSCGYACPRITADMQKIASKLREASGSAVQFTMASFDAEHDSPEQLAIFAETKGIDDSWQLLHGDESTVRELAAALDIRYRREPDGNIAHSNLIVLLDEQGRIIYRHEGLGGDLGPIIESARKLVEAK